MKHRLGTWILVKAIVFSRSLIYSGTTIVYKIKFLDQYINVVVLFVRFKYDLLNVVFLKITNLTVHYYDL